MAGKYKRLRFHASQTASESSTIAEEIVVLLRRLHSLPAWNSLINQFIGSNLQTIPSIVVPLGGDHSSSLLGQAAGDIKDQVGVVFCSVTWPTRLFVCGVIILSFC